MTFSSIRRPDRSARRDLRPALEPLEARELLSELSAFFRKVDRPSAWFSLSQRPVVAEVRGLNRWMSFVPDNTPLSDMSIPGTHDSGTGDTKVFFLPYIQTQTWSIPNQLNAGIRFLDIRVQPFPNTRSPSSFLIVHGVFSMHEFLDDVLNNCVTFLKNNPSESIVMSVKQDSGRVNEANFTRIFNSYLNNPKWKDFFYTKATVPNLGDVRGKIVLVKRTAGGTGIPWPGVGTSPLVVDDQYDVRTRARLNSKIQGMGKNLNASVSGNPGWHITFASATGASGLSYLPETISYTTNKYVYDFANQTRQGRLGVIPMDFPGEGAIVSIVNTNRFQASGTRGLGDPLFPLPAVGPVSTTVDALLRFGFHGQPTTLVARFSAPLDPASAEDTSNYQLEEFTPSGGTIQVPIAAATYDPTTNAVTLRPSSHSLTLFAPYQLVISGTAPGGVRDATGELIDGNGDGTPGGDYVELFDTEALAGPNPTTSAVVPATAPAQLSAAAVDAVLAQRGTGVSRHAALRPAPARMKMGRAS